MNAYFAHLEHILLAMLGDGENNVRNQPVQIILKVRKAASLEENPKGLHLRQFVISTIDCKATTYYKMSTLSTATKRELPAIKDKSTFAIKAFAENKFLLMHSCHNQAVERHVKLVTEAANTAKGFSRRDRISRQQIKSSHQMKCFELKKQYNV